ncbi:MAG: MFS transporter [Lachnospiraceae bacterium]|nr:MFS transporter [Lachnospiraceae bacterium]
MAGKMTRLEKQWILYDVGNSAFTMLCTTIIPIYFKNIATADNLSNSDSTAFLSFTLSLSTILVAVLGPILGTMADTKNYKKPLFVSTFLVGVIGCMAMAFASKWLAFLAVFCIAKTGYQLSLIFYDSMLTDVTTEDRMDEISSQGYAWGYIGSCVPFIASLVLILGSDVIGISGGMAMTLALFLNAVWWAGVTIPLIRNYRQIHYVEKVKHPVKESFRRIVDVVKGLKHQRKILFFLLGFFFYIDGVYTIIDMATTYGKDVGISDTDLVLALLMTQVVAFPCSIAFGKISKRFKNGSLIQVSILAYFLIAVFALQLDKAWEFWFLAVCVAVFQGAIQALSRSYFAKIIPKEKSSEYFGFYDIFGKGAAFIGTTVMGISTMVSGSSRYGVAILSLMFLVGFFFFRKAEKEE